MLRKLLLLICLVSTITVIAQKKRSASARATEKQTDPKMDYKQIGSPMPPFKLMLYQDTALRKENKELKNEFLTGKDLDNGANLFVMMFNPTCGHCMDATTMLEKNISLFTRSKIVLMASTVMIPYMPDFYKSLHISEYPSMFIGFDSSNFIGELFLYHALPQINIYDSGRKLIKTYTGEIALDSLKQYIQ